MADSFVELSGKLDRLAASLDGRALRAITTKIAVAAKKDVEVEVAKDAGADRAMRNWKRATLNSRYDIIGDGSAVVKPSPSGPWKVLDQGAAAHTVSAKGARASGRGSRSINAARRAARASGQAGAFAGSRPLKTPFGPRYSVHLKHGRGKGTWRSAQLRIGRETPKRVADEVHRAMTEVFR